MRNNSHELRLGNKNKKIMFFHFVLLSPFTIFAFIYYVMIENVYGIINK